MDPGSAAEPQSSLKTRNLIFLSCPSVSALLPAMLRKLGPPRRARERRTLCSSLFSLFPFPIPSVVPAPSIEPETTRQPQNLSPLCVPCALCGNPKKFRGSPLNPDRRVNQPIPARPPSRLIFTTEGTESTERGERRPSADRFSPGFSFPAILLGVEPTNQVARWTSRPLGKTNPFFLPLSVSSGVIPFPPSQPSGRR